MKIYSVDVTAKIPIAVFMNDSATDEEICDAAFKEAKELFGIELRDIERMAIFEVNRDKFYAELKKMREAVNAP